MESRPCSAAANLGPYWTRAKMRITSPLSRKISLGGFKQPCWRPIVRIRELAAHSASVDQEDGDGSWLMKMQEEQKLQSSRLDSNTREKVMSEVEELGNRVTVGDVAGGAGVSLFEAEEALKALAADSAGNLEVSNDGEVVYVLPSGFRNKILARSFVMRWEPALKKFREVAGSLGRAAFGLGFVVTVISVWVAVIAISSSGSNREDNRSHRSHGGMYMAFDLLDAFRWWYYFSRPSTPRPTGELGFMKAVYSCVFGDGDPNKNFEETRWNLIGQYIQSRGGVVVGEELAPFLDPPKSDVMDDATNRMFPDEGYMLPVLTKFGGEPKVSDQGDLLYTFPKLQQSGSKTAAIGPVESYVQEDAWKMTIAKKSHQVLVALLAAANIVGVYALKSAMASVPELAPVAPGLIALQVYAWSFVIVPLTRFFTNRQRNAKISERNQAREQAAVQLKFPTAELKKKIHSARRLGGRQLVSDRDIMFSTEKSASEFEGEDFDRRLAN